MAALLCACHGHQCCHHARWRDVSLGGDRPLLTPYSDTATIFAVFGVSFVASWLIEALLLKLLKRDGDRPFIKSLIINIASYILLFALATIGFN